MSRVVAEKPLLDKIAIVTGGGQGLGQAICFRLADEGAHVVVADINAQTAEETAALVMERTDRKAIAVQVNVTDEAQVEAMVQRTVDEFGRLDVLVNNAGVLRSGPVEEFDAKGWAFVMNVNLYGYFLCVKHACRAMKPQGSGAIINITSVHAFRGMLDHSLYASTKAAIVGFTRTLAIELAPKGIRVNAIAPGMIVVENYYKNIPDFDVKTASKSVPIGFAGEPRDIARVAIFLASDDARYIVGQTIVADGGQNSCIPVGEGYKESLGITWGKNYTPWL